MIAATITDLGVLAFVVCLVVGGAIRSLQTLGWLPLPKPAQRWREIAETNEKFYEREQVERRRIEAERQALSGRVATLEAMPNLEQHAAILRESLDGQRAIMAALVAHDKRSTESTEKTSLVLDLIAEQLKVSLNGREKPR